MGWWDGWLDGRPVGFADVVGNTDEDGTVVGNAEEVGWLDGASVHWYGSSGS